MINRAVYKIMNSHIHEWPYPHIIVDNVFDPEFYLDLIAEWPHKGFRPFRGYENRFEWVPPGAVAKPAWVKFLKEFNHRFIEAMMAKFEVRWAKPKSYVHLCLDKPGYFIEPHPDVANKLVTCIFYMPLPNPEGYNPGIRSGEHGNGTTIMNGRDADAYTVPFVANRLVAFKVGKNSWHRVKAGPDPRTSIQYFILKESDQNA